MMTRLLVWLRRERNRAYLYRGLVGTAPVAVAYGYVSDQEAVVLLGFAGAWLGVGLATTNTSTKEDAR